MGCLSWFFVIGLSSCVNLATASAEPSKEVLQEERLEELSLKELMSIPLTTDYSQHKIYQSDINKIGSNTVNFGVLAPVSEFPVYSVEIIAAADLAADLVNRNGGINGRRLVILRADDKENTPVSARLVKQLVDDYKVQAIIGPATSNSVADVFQKGIIPQQIPLISHAATSMVLSEIAGDRAFWRMAGNNQQQIDLMANFLHQQLGLKRVYLITGRDIYSREIANGIKTYYGKVADGWVDHLSISDKVFLDVMDLSDEIKEIQQQGVGAIIITLVNAQVAGMIRQIRNNWVGRFPIIMIGDTVTPKYLEDADLGEINACIFSYVGTPTDLDPRLSQKIKTAIQTNATGFDGAYVYDATMILAMGKVLAEEFNLPIKQAVLKVAGDGFRVTPDDFAQIKTLYQTHQSFSFYGYSGRVHFNNNGDNLTAFEKLYSLSGDIADTKRRCMQLP